MYGLSVLDTSKGEVNSLANMLLRLGDFVLPEALHCPGHDDQGAVAD